jgi:hypothetical protein
MLIAVIVLATVGAVTVVIVARLGDRFEKYMWILLPLGLLILAIGWVAARGSKSKRAHPTQ